ncbi:short chain dehydrogenase [Novosphingobium marinum]|uniref:NAD(P)-dependent dehydrogenase (Short-subunit alcohol dehydrogenase family) n=1 Tax=Novosphingobium marinum TaxID=1514948 RepID=A0A7Z0BVI0_9SPHN|nr:SDR family oxidoreductase [Novosphingobium marinum]NYH95375.1 NAD(P)-dependent dehydrogenase (short-subunit alcohol dehydrogenase family) [Novosphingobium marinum]GGC26554.1 short chain dehydrogenase [Novosphingobium marinum]
MTGDLATNSTRPGVLVTGGAKRIGARIVKGFARAGWHVTIHCNSSREEADRLAASLPHASVVTCDLADGDAAVAMIEELAETIRNWRVLVNCAGLFERDLATGLDPRTFGRAMQVNAAAPARMAQAFLARARADGGRRVIHLTDQKLANPNPDFFSYTMSKHALASTVRMLAMAQDDPRDRVYGLAPGAILASHDQTEEETERSHRLNLLERKTGADEIADAALFLAGGWLASGKTMFVDSGQHLLSQPRDVLYLARQ